MYVPEHFRESDPALLHELIRQHPFAPLVSQTPEGLFATHLPFLLDAARGPNGTLVGHMARANPHWRSLEGGEALVIFQGPHAYVTPQWYKTPVAVPTWNYAVVHARGPVTLIQDGPRLREIVEETVATFEAAFDYKWPMPEGDLVPNLLRQVVGFEIPIARLDGKLKLNQNRSRADREGVVEGLRAQGEPEGTAVAEMMAERL